jgi:hypothetical protein
MLRTIVCGAIGLTMGGPIGLVAGVLIGSFADSNTLEERRPPDTDYDHNEDDDKY